MNVAIVGDVHLTLKRYPEFESNRFNLLIDELIKAKPNIVIFAGDLLDTNKPTLAEQQLLLSALRKFKDANIKVRIISGNHEALSRTENLYDFILEYSDVYVKDNYLYHVKHKPNPNLGIRLIGWTNIREAQHIKDSNVLITHLRADYGLIKEEYDIQSLSDTYKLVFMGDIHCRYSPYPNVHYTSVPYSSHFSSKNKNDYGYIMYNTETEEWEYKDLDLPNKIKIKCSASSIDELTKGMDKHLIKIEVSGTLEELKNLPEKSNIIYVKQVQEIAQVQVQQQVSSNPLDGLYNLIEGTDFLKRYPDKSERVKEKINELKGN